MPVSPRWKRSTKRLREELQQARYPNTRLVGTFDSEGNFTRLPRQCEAVSPQGLRCGHDYGHSGEHHALGRWHTDPKMWRFADAENAKSGRSRSRRSRHLSLPEEGRTCGS